MADVNIEIGTKGDVSGIKAIGRESQNLFTQIKQSFKSLQAPMQRMADRQAVDRKMGNLERKANELERKMAQAKLGGLEGQYGPAAGPRAAEKFKADLERVNLQRTVMRTEAFDRQAIQQAGGPSFMGGIGRAGRFTAGKALKYGGAIAGMAGAYSLFSGIAGGVSSAGEMNMAYANALLTGRGGNIPDYSENKPIFEVSTVLKDTAFMVSKDMIPLLDVVKELGDFSKGAAKGLIEIANLGARQGVSSALISSILTGGLQSGSFSKRNIFNRAEGTPGQWMSSNANRMIASLLMSPNMANRGTEAIQSFAQVLQGTVQGVQGTPSSGIFALLKTMNDSRFNAYRGAGGANALLRVNQAFTGGGNENFQYFQNLALNPAFQEANARRVSTFNASDRGPTDYGSGQYDQIIADVMGDLGAFSTPIALVEELTKLDFKGAASYVLDQYRGSMNKMNIQRTFEQYESAYGKGEGNRLFMTAQLAKDMGVSFSDVGVLSQALKSDSFKKLAIKGGLSPEEMAAFYKESGPGATGEALKIFKAERAKKEEAMIETGKAIRKMADDLLPELNKLLPVLTEGMKMLTTGVVDLVSGVSGFLEYIGAKDKTGGGERSLIAKGMTHEYGLLGYLMDEFISSPTATNTVSSFSKSQAQITSPEFLRSTKEDISKGAAPLITGSFWEKVGTDIATGFMSAFKDKELPSGTINISGKSEVSN